MNMGVFGCKYFLVTGEAGLADRFESRQIGFGGGVGIVTIETFPLTDRLMLRNVYGDRDVTVVAQGSILTIKLKGVSGGVVIFMADDAGIHSERAMQIRQRNFNGMAATDGATGGAVSRGDVGIQYDRI